MKSIHDFPTEVADTEEASVDNVLAEHAISSATILAGTKIGQTLRLTSYTIYRMTRETYDKPPRYVTSYRYMNEATRFN